jgi:hypothetical protein
MFRAQAACTSNAGYLLGPVLIDSATPPAPEPAAVWLNQRTEREVVCVGGGSANGVRWCASTLSRPEGRALPAG